MYERGSLTLLHFRGIPIRAHWTLLLVLPYLAFVLSVQFKSLPDLAGIEQGSIVLPPLLWGVILALGLFASVALHEMAHSVIAIRFGGRVRAITLMLLGGASQITHMPPRPRYEALMALAGPATSLALGALFLLLQHAMAIGPADVQMGLFYLGYMNVALGLFNLVPVFPMDGGRILRAALAARMGGLRATLVAAGIGRAAAILMGLLGLWSGNVLLILIAVFVYFGAGAEATSARVREALEGLRVVDLVPLIRRPPATISEAAALTEVLPRMHDAGRLELVVTNSQGAPLTVIQAADLATIEAGDLARLRVRDLMARFGARHIIAPWDASANEVLQRAAEKREPYIIVTDPAMTAAHGLVGLLAASDIETMIKLRLAEPSDKGTGTPRSVIPSQHAHTRAV